MKNSGLYYDRKYQIIINNGEEIKTIESPEEPTDHSLAMAFQVVKTADLKSNDSEITLYNLNEASRNLIIKNANLELYAGYKNQIGLIYKGIVEFVSHVKQGTDWETKISCRDAALHWREIGVSLTFEKETPVDKMIDKLIDVLTLPPEIDAKLKEMNKLTKAEIKNLPKKLFPKEKKQTAKQTKRKRLTDEERAKREKQKEQEKAKKKIVAAQQKEVIKLEKAEVIKGSAMKALEYICATFNLKPIIENQALSIFPIDLKRAVEDDLIYLTPDSGLIGSPEPIEKGGYRIVSLLRYDFRLFSDVVVSSAELEGVYRIKRVEYNGERDGQNWYAIIEGDPV